MGEVYRSIFIQSCTFSCKPCTLRAELLLPLLLKTYVRVRVSTVVSLRALSSFYKYIASRLFQYYVHVLYANMSLKYAIKKISGIIGVREGERESRGSCVCVFSVLK